MTPNWLCSSIVTCWPYRRIGIGQFGELCPRYIGAPLTFSLCIYGFDINHHIWYLGLSMGQLLQLQSCTHTTNYDYSCPLIDTGGISLWLYCSVKSQYIGPQGRSGKTIRGFLGHLTDSTRQNTGNRHQNLFYRAGLYQRITLQCMRDWVKVYNGSTDKSKSCNWQLKPWGDEIQSHIVKTKFLGMKNLALKSNSAQSARVSLPM